MSKINRTDTERKIIGQWIKMIRSKYDLTQHQMADVLGINQVVLARWEKGLHYPNAKHLELLLSIRVKVSCEN